MLPSWIRSPQRDAAVHVAPRDADDQPQVGLDQAAARFRAVRTSPSRASRRFRVGRGGVPQPLGRLLAALDRLGQLDFLGTAQQGYSTNLLQVERQRLAGGLGIGERGRPVLGTIRRDQPSARGISRAWCRSDQHVSPLSPGQLRVRWQQTGHQRTVDVAADRTPAARGSVAGRIAHASGQNGRVLRD